MSVEIRVPSLGESVTEATVARWFKKIGDDVTADEPLVELETDKVTLEYNAPASGVLAEILVDEGGEVEVGALLGAINEGAGQAAKSESTADGGGTKPQAKSDGAAANGEAASGADLTPAVRKLIDEHDLDPTTIKPTGPKGNITKGDVLAAIEDAKSGKASATAKAPEPKPAEPAPAAKPQSEASA
jgi:2-oxoglutarate dehydrogenase E2 component (dihydrolipoamide succinyltransferase)